MVGQQNWVDFADEVIRLVRLDSNPVGVKLYNNASDVPAEAEETQEMYTFCQFVTLARIHGKVLKVSMKNLWCSIAQTYLGMGLSHASPPPFQGYILGKLSIFNIEYLQLIFARCFAEHSPALCLITNPFARVFAVTRLLT